jgi:hypothetical protein
MHHAIFIDEKNNVYHFRVDGNSVYIYANCYQTAEDRLKEAYGQDITIS